MGNCPPAFVAEQLGEYLHLLRSGQNAQREQTMLLVSLLSQFISSLKSPQSGFKGSLASQGLYIVYRVYIYNMGILSIYLSSLLLLCGKLDLKMCSFGCRYCILRSTKIDMNYELEVTFLMLLP